MRFKTVSVRLKEDQLAILNSMLNQHGFQTLSDYVHALIEGRVDLYKEQVERFAEIIANKTLGYCQQLSTKDSGLSVNALVAEGSQRVKMGSVGFEPTTASSQGWNPKPN